jgi:twinfilin-like protein
MTYIASRKIETSDPKELDESHLRAALALKEEEVDMAGVAKGEDARPFRRPKRPAKKR